MARRVAIALAASLVVLGCVLVGVVAANEKPEAGDVTEVNSSNSVGDQSRCFVLVQCVSITNVSFRAAVSALRAFLSSRHSSALYCFYCIVSVLMNKIFIHVYSSSSPLRRDVSDGRGATRM